MTYDHVSDARKAVAEFDGANAKGQPIRLSLIPLPSRRENPFDKVENPRSLFDRIEAPTGRSRRRSDSPVSDVEDDRGYRRDPDEARHRQAEETDEVIPLNLHQKTSTAMCPAQGMGPAEARVIVVNVVADGQAREETEFREQRMVVIS